MASDWVSIWEKHWSLHMLKLRNFGFFWKAIWSRFHFRQVYRSAFDAGINHSCLQMNRMTEMPVSWLQFESNQHGNVEWDPECREREMQWSFDTHYGQLYSLANLSFKYVFPDNEIILVIFEESHSIYEFELQEFELDYGQLKRVGEFKQTYNQRYSQNSLSSLVRATSAE